jgi:hypothetical protein
MDRMRPALFIALLELTSACGGSVVVEDDTSFEDSSLAELLPGTAGGGQGDPGCTACAVGDCGWCDYEGGDEAFRCQGDRAPESSLACVQTGSVYHDADGSYVCWRCDG